MLVLSLGINEGSALVLKTWFWFAVAHRSGKTQDRHLVFRSLSPLQDSQLVFRSPQPQSKSAT